MPTITVFIADDHRIIRDGLRLVLETEGGVTVVGKEAADAVRAVHNGRGYLSRRVADPATGA